MASDEPVDTDHAFSIVLIGGGVLCTYAMERLAALLPRRAGAFTVTVVDRSGRFGAGETHSDLQPSTSYLNRAAGQIALGADGSVVAADELLPAGVPTFMQWLAQRCSEGRDERFALRATDMPRRFVHGVALRDAFDRYATVLRSCGHVIFSCVHADAVDIAEPDGAHRALCVHLSDGTTLAADAALVATGHRRWRTQDAPVAGQDAGGSGFAARATYAYPIEHIDGRVTAGSTVRVLGMGLAAIDVILHLTEGRGGRYVTDADAVLPIYVPSGAEPKLIVAESPSGLLPRARPLNEKIAVPGSEHRAIYLTTAAIDRLRRSVGRPACLRSAGVVNQLDFDDHVQPLMMLEMAHVYYRVLLGDGYAERARRLVWPHYEAFLDDGDGTELWRASALALDAEFDETVASLSTATARLRASASAVESVGSFTRCVYGEALRPEAWRAALQQRRPSPWGHPVRLAAHRFTPAVVGDAMTVRPAVRSWTDAQLHAGVRDLVAARQGNLSNPVKAAIDAVWRDLRAEICHAVDRGGLVAASHRRFIDVHLRHYNRRSNGPGIEAMSKVLALVQQGLVVLQPADAGSAGTRGDAGPAVRADHTIEARVHPFDVSRIDDPMYVNLLTRGLVRRWRNPGADGDFEPGGLDLDESFRPYRRDGVVDPRLTFLGAPTEGVAFFQASAGRPNSSNYVLRNVAAWSARVVERSAP
jgi:hypothetical protein